MESTLIDRIDSRLKAVGLSRTAACRAAGVNDNAIKAIAQGRSNNPRIDTIKKLANVLECSADWLATGDGAVSPLPEPDGHIEHSPILPGRETMDRDIPVLGSAVGGPDGALNLDGPIDFARRPDPLRRAQDVYCIYVSGESMVPQFQPGMHLYVSERIPPVPGDAVVIQCLCDNGGQDKVRLAFIKLLKRKVGGGTRYWQHNEPGEWEPPGRVVAVHRIYPWNELLPTH